MPTPPEPEPKPERDPGRDPGPGPERRDRLDAAETDRVRQAFSANYYRQANPDVAAFDIDPLDHFLTFGWREGRNPTPDFDVAYYLSRNEDIARSGLNPFWHWLTSGRDEGRWPSRPGGYRRDAIDRARPHTPWDWDPPTPVLSTDGQAALRKALAAGAGGLVLSLSHDCYVRSVGGTQIVISDEQHGFNARGLVYLHLSPARPQLGFAAQEEDFMLRLVLDGDELGVIVLPALLALLPAKATATLILHSFLGFTRQAIVSLARALRPRESYYWLHDHAALCPGYNLLRNDVAFCHAPPPDSMACRVCVHGAGRGAHLAEVRGLFEAIGWRVLAPSESALALFTAKTRLPIRDARVHPHWRLAWQATSQERPVAEPVVTVAFIGHPVIAKGWPIFAALAERLIGDDRYRFVHLETSGQSPAIGVIPVQTRVSAEARFVTIERLRDLRADLVLVLSTWPETFSFVTFEALAAGAAVICLPDSGNVMAMVERTGRGLVVADEAALQRCFASGEAVELARRWRGPDLAIVESGTAATLAGEV